MDATSVWNEAERKCMEQGSHLTTIMDETEMVFLYGLLLNQKGLTLLNAYIGKHLSENKCVVAYRTF